jgi:DNA-binding NtrC family response regulator
MSETLGSVLIVDGEAVSRRSLTLAFKSWGYTVYEATDGEEALELYREHAPALVVTELAVSPLDGLELLRRLRSEDPYAAVVVLTSFGTMDIAKTAMRRGATDFLTKPTDYARLKALLGKSLPARGVAPGELVELAPV